MSSWLVHRRKAIVAVVGVLVQVAQSGLVPVPDKWQPWITAGIALATAAGVYSIRNGKKVRRPAMAAAAAVRRQP